MRPFTLRSDVVTRDKSTKQVDRITKSYMKMTNTINKQSKIANNSFKRFTNNISTRAKRVMVSMNNMNASINRGFRNLSKKLGSLGLIVGFTAIFSLMSSGIGVFANFEQANAGLAAVMGKTVEQNAALITDSKRLGAITAKTSTEVVGLQEAYARLGFAEKDILNLTESTIAGSIAMKGELADTAELVGAMVKSFDAFESINAPTIIDQMTLATQKSALNFEKLQNGLPIVAGAANAAGVPFTRLLSLLGKLSDAGIDTSSSATALRNIFIDSAKKGHTYEQILENIQKNQSKLTAANDEFGKRAAVSAVILAKNIDATKELDLALQSAKNTAQEAADKQLNTLQGRITLLGSAYEGFILSLDDGTGAMSGFLKKTIEVATEILALGSGTAKAKDQLNSAELSIRKMANTAIFLLKTIKFITIAYLTFKAVMIATKIITTAYNIVVGIQAALFGTLNKSIVANKAALMAYTIVTRTIMVVTKIWTGIQAAFNAVMSANPIALVILAIAALVAGIILLIRNWQKITTWIKTSDNAFAKLIRFGLKPIIFLFKQIKEAWINIKNAFKGGGILGGIKQIGKSLLSFMLAPLEGILKLTNKLTGGKVGGKALERIEKFRDSLNFKGEVKKETTVISTQNAMVSSIDKNTEELQRNTDASKQQMSGRFITSILRDANISERSSGITQRELAITAITNERSSGIIQRELATTVIANENNVANDQKEVVNDSVVTPQPARRPSNVNGTINIVVENKTGGNFAVEVEGTGINVTTTGNG